jgi:Lon protease-like protein
MRSDDEFPRPGMRRRRAPFDDPMDPLPTTFPIFPLESVVLVPGALLPLHVFEPRYRAMIRDVVAENGMLAMAMPARGHVASLDGSPPVHPVIGLGRIVSSEEHPDGRWTILLEGVARMRIEEELPPTHEYRRVRASPLPDIEPDDETVLRSAFFDVLGRLPDLDAEVREALLAIDTGAAIDAVLVRLPIPAREKHRVHAEPSQVRRVGAVRRLIDALLGRHPGVDVEPGDPRLN